MGMRIKTEFMLAIFSNVFRILTFLQPFGNVLKTFAVCWVQANDVFKRFPNFLRRFYNLLETF